MMSEVLKDGRKGYKLESKGDGAEILLSTVREFDIFMGGTQDGTDSYRRGKLVHIKHEKALFSGNHYLRLSDDESNRAFVIEEGREYFLGRNEHVIPIVDPSRNFVSRRHIAITLLGNKVSIIQEGATNPTYIIPIDRPGSVKPLIMNAERLIHQKQSPNRGIDLPDLPDEKIPAPSQPLLDFAKILSSYVEEVQRKKQSEAQGDSAKKERENNPLGLERPVLGGAEWLPPQPEVPQKQEATPSEIPSSDRPYVGRRMSEAEERMAARNIENQQIGQFLQGPNGLPPGQGAIDNRRLLEEQNGIARLERQHNPLGLGRSPLGPPPLGGTPFSR